MWLRGCYLFHLQPLSAAQRLPRRPFCRTKSGCCLYSAAAVEETLRGEVGPESSRASERQGKQSNCYLRAFRFIKITTKLASVAIFQFLVQLCQRNFLHVSLFKCRYVNNCLMLGFSAFISCIVLTSYCFSAYIGSAVLTSSGIKSFLRDS